MDAHDHAEPDFDSVTFVLTLATCFMLLIVFSLIVVACSMRAEEIAAIPDECDGCTTPTVCQTPYCTGGGICQFVIGRCYCNATSTCVGPKHSKTESILPLIAVAASFLGIVLLVLIMTLLKLLIDGEPRLKRMFLYFWNHPCCGGPPVTEASVTMSGGGAPLLTDPVGTRVGVSDDLV